MASMSIDALIEAAQFLEENGHDDSPRHVKRNRSYRVKKPSTYSRTTHNLLEKNRRAQLRDCLEVLRQHVPLPDKLTTLALLQSAKKYIETLQHKERDETELKLKLQSEQAFLLSRLTELGAGSIAQSTLNSTPKTAPPPNITPPPASFSERSQIERRSSSPKAGKGLEEDENMVIDVISHESEDESSSTTSGSDGGCTTTSHKYEIAV